MVRRYYSVLTNNKLLQVYLAKNAGEEEGAGILQVVVPSNASSLHRIHQQPTCSDRTWIILQINHHEGNLLIIEES
jgi:hypothetical protein